MPAKKSTKGISRIDQPEKHNHGFFVRLQCQRKIHSAFFADKSHGGREQALAAAQKHYRGLLLKFGSTTTPPQFRWLKEAIGGGQGERPVRPPDLDSTQLKRVQCRGYRCLAYRNAKGRWVNFYTGKVLTDMVKLVD